MLVLVVDVAFVLTVTVNVALLSQPAALVKPVLICVPAALNVNPFQLYGKALGQTAKLLVELVTALTVTVNVALLYQTCLFNNTFLVCFFFILCFVVCGWFGWGRP